MSFALAQQLARPQGGRSLAALYVADESASPTYTTGISVGTTIRVVDITEVRAALVAIE